VNKTPKPQNPKTPIFNKQNFKDLDLMWSSFWFGFFAIFVPSAPLSFLFSARLRQFIVILVGI